VNRVLTRLRVPLGFLVAVWYLFVAHPHSPNVLLLCTALVILGCLLRAWAAGYLLKGKRVAVGGPYAWIRNPLYGGSFIIAAGFCTVLWAWPLPPANLILLLVFIMGFGVVYRAKTLAEEKELSTNLGAPYVAYAQAVPPFLPWRGHVRGLGEQRFSWELYKRNREYQCILGSVALLIYLFCKLNYGN
jgi:protein-S-isoprenylcysteine O-methyltransferase Ste14